LLVEPVATIKIQNSFRMTNHNFIQTEELLLLTNQMKTNNCARERRNRRKCDDVFVGVQNGSKN
jgi:hypothetical protein